MRVLVCGSRNFTDKKLMQQALGSTTFDPALGDILIHGGAKGADKLADKCVRELYPDTNIDHLIEEYPADWEKHGKAAGPIRNKQMLEEGKPDLVIAFLAPDSVGTKNMIEQAEKAGVKVQVIECK